MRVKKAKSGLILSLITFSKVLLESKALVEALRLSDKVINKNSLNSRNFLIILCKESILSLCFAMTAAIAVVIIEITMLIINCYIKRFITNSRI